MRRDERLLLSDLIRAKLEAEDAARSHWTRWNEQFRRHFSYTGSGRCVECGGDLETGRYTLDCRTCRERRRRHDPTRVRSKQRSAASLPPRSGETGRFVSDAKS
jgi:hypothetical protein